MANKDYKIKIAIEAQTEEVKAIKESVNNISESFDELKKFSGFYSVIKNCNYSNDNCGINECLKSFRHKKMEEI